MFERKIDRYEYLLASPSIQRLLRNKAPNTQYYYLWRFDQFLKFTGPELGLKDPDSWLAWAKSRKDSLEVEDIIEKFAETQPTHSQAYAIAGLRSHLKRNGYTALPSMGRSPVLKSFHPGFKREEIQAILGYLDQPVQKLYVLFAKDSGLRAHDLLSLRYRHVKKELEAASEYVHLYLEPAFYNRKKASGITFIGPNTVKLLRELVEKGKVARDPDSRVFPFTYNTINEGLRLARTKAGIEETKQPSHGLRKFFENSLDRVGMDVHKKLQLEGHSLGTRFHYTDQGVEELRELYKQAYRFLDLSEEAAADNRVRDLEKTVKEQREYIEALKGEVARITTKVEAEVADQRKMLEELKRKQSRRPSRK